ncbi:N-acetylmuramoyl-L-alanine amidase family protein [Flavobacterium undicola]|uniref:N-acetylmuramoyl-L-alanine amidase family protein n=1 Tax=Flavobacterium undicola TaxID=1932779 RepID=UPI0013787C03|nr:N-acetylmuramoyl-L-alanine amidase [Flavobacterium undicola]MBA0882366.1 N-acetylmuramoyl-L-alanine amidase [Flavobacterium undicola]
MKSNYKNFVLMAILMLFGFSSVFSQNNKVFKVILDAGHGGKDPGNSYHGFVEKEIALKTVLKVGEFLEKAHGVKVIYTRTSDVFIELVDRPKVANKANADLFVSIHCNSVKNEGPNGTETFVMGLSRHDMNLEVAKKENSVILLEKDYKTKYQGFDPKKPETLIGLTMIQEENLNNSIALASRIQGNFTKKIKRGSRGVKQQPLWVLDAAYMPSVLIELGFLSNKSEGSFLDSEEGQTKMAEQIADAILDYKSQYFETSDSKYDYKEKKDSTKKKTNEVSVKKTDSADLIYKVQLLASPKKIKLQPSNFKGLENVSYVFLNNLYRYMYGGTSSFEEAKKKQLEARSAGYLKAFIVNTNEE